jgi:hypothetical protein
MKPPLGVLILACAASLAQDLCLEFHAYAPPRIPAF